MNRRRFLAATLVNLDLALSALCLAALVLLTALGVFQRYALGSPIVWLEEMQTLLFVWVAFFGSSVAFRHGGHIAIEAVVEMFPARLRRAVEALDSLLVVAVLAMVMYWEFSRGLTLMRTGRSTSVLGIPVCLNYFGVSVACLFMLCHFLRERLGGILARRRGSEAGQVDDNA